MKIDRIFYLCFLASVWLFLSGFNDLVEKDSLVLQGQDVTVKSNFYEIGQAQVRKKILKVKAKSNHLKVKADVKIKESVDDASIKATGIEKILDLSIPFSNSKDVDSLIELQRIGQKQSPDYFDTKTKKEPRHIELDGDFLMSPEPQGEKLKSVDGAGLVINLKP
jgi:hypothetical protein